jgi:hypothetical protein
MNAMQKMAWKNFQIAFPEDEDCLEEIIKYLNEIGWVFRCSRCNSSELRRKRGMRRYICSDCHYKGWILAGTYFEFMRKSRLWLGLIWFLEHGIQINALQFHQLAKCAYSTALMIFRKLGSVLHEHLESMQEVDSAESREFLSIFWKRSNQTPIGEHPSLEQECFDLELNDIEDEGENDNTTKDLREDEAQILQLISDQKIHLDHICQLSGLYCGDVIGSLTFLEMSNLVERHGGDYYTLKKKKIGNKRNRSDVPNSATTQVKIDSFITFVQGQIHGISRKYLQYYLAIFWCFEDRKRWSPSELLKACCRSTFRASRELFQFVTESRVLVM